MIINEVAASLYPWDLADEGIENIADSLQTRSNVNSLYLVGVMHFEKRPLTSLFYSHNPNRKYYLPENSRVYYYMDMESFRGTQLKPQFSERDFLKNTDWLEVLIAEARKRGMKAGVELSHTIYDTSIARKEHPDTLQRGIDGQILSGWQEHLCPNHPDVHEYQCAMFYDTVKNHDVDFIQTCLLTFEGGNAVKAPWFLSQWLDDSRNNLGALIGVANGGCFCEHCKAKAIQYGYDWDVILRDMKKLYAIANATPYRFQDELMENNMTLGSNLTEATLLMEYPGLLQFLQFRVRSITELFKDIYTRVHAVKPSIDFRYNNYVHLPELTGISFKDIAPYVDSVRDSDYSEQYGAPDKFLYKRNTLLKIRRGIGFEKRLLAALAVRPNATPEIIKESLKVLATLGLDGLSLGHYDCAHLEHLDAVSQGMKEANIVIKR